MELLGLAEVSELLGLTKRGTQVRRKQPDFPRPRADLRCGPVWLLDDVVVYARERSAQFEERPAIEELAREDDGYVSVAEAAELIGVSELRIRQVARDYPSMPRRLNRRSGEITAIHRSDLGLYARALGARFVETAA